MSYILDALKKSDRERSRERGPTLASVHGQWRPPTRRVSRIALSLGLLGLMFLAGLGIRQWWAGHASEPTVSAAAVPTAKEASTAPIAEAGPAPAVGDAATESPAQRQPADPQEMEPAPLQELWELPDPVRADFPALTFSFHVYSETPSRRAIIINNRRHSEGDSIGAELRLEEITQEGVVLQFRDYRVHIPIVNDW